MNGNPDGHRSLAKYSKLPVERIRYVPDADERVVRAITRGVLFQMAFWSGPAVQAFAKLTEVVATLDPEAGPRRNEALHGPIPGAGDGTRGLQDPPPNPAQDGARGRRGRQGDEADGGLAVRDAVFPAEAQVDRNEAR
jgi:hypothetical protein